MANKKSITEKRAALRNRALGIANKTSGSWVDKRYAVRNALIQEFGITSSYAQRIAIEVVKK